LQGVGVASFKVELLESSKVEAMLVKSVVVMQLEGGRLCLRIETRFNCEFGHWMALTFNGGEYFANYVQQNKCSLGID